MSQLNPADRDAILLYATFSLVAVLTLALPLGTPMGLRICGLVIFFNIAVPASALRCGHTEWLDLWLFLLPLSALQIFPDWLLADQLNVLVFPDTGSPYIGPVPIFMAGMWTIPLFVILLLGRRVAVGHSRGIALTTVAATSILLFAGSEATLWRIPIWHAQNVTTVARVALYLVIPETLLGVHTFLAFESSLGHSIWQRLDAAFTVMSLYMGGVCFFYLLVEQVLSL